METRKQSVQNGENARTNELGVDREHARSASRSAGSASDRSDKHTRHAGCNVNVCLKKRRCQIVITSNDTMFLVCMFLTSKYYA